MAKAETLQTALHFATDKHVKKNGLYKVPNSLIVEAGEDLNDRRDYGTEEELKELAESLYHSGPRNPLKGFKEGENYVVVVGHRRKRAADYIQKKYGQDLLFQFVVYAPGTTRGEMILDGLLTNSGKDFNPLEKASAVVRLMNEEEMPANEIRQALGGVTEKYVKDLAKLNEAPEKAKKLILDGTISATYLMAEMRKKGFDLDKFIEEVLSAKAGAKKKGSKTGKVTKKDVEKKREKNETRAASSLGEFKRFRKTGNDIFENKNKQEQFEFLCSLIDNQLSYDQILTYFTGK